MRGKAAAAGYRETVGIGRPTSDQGPAGHRGIDDGMSVNGDRTQHGKPHAVRVRDPQPDAREGQAGPLGVAERSVVPAKPGHKMALLDEEFGDTGVDLIRRWQP